MYWLKGNLKNIDDHIKELIGKMGTIKYFGMTNTEHPVPNLPVFKSVRLDKDV